MRELSGEIHHIKTEGEGKALADTQEELKETREIKDKVTHDLEKAKKVGLQSVVVIESVSMFRGCQIINKEVKGKGFYMLLYAIGLRTLSLSLLDVKIE